MHASLIAKQIVAAVLAEASRRKARGVRSVDVELGALSGVAVEELREAFGIEATRTVLAGADLRVHPREGKGFVIRSASLVLGDD